MIAINNIREIQEEFIECDLYVPINIEFGQWDISKDPSIYWRRGDFSKNLLEVGFGKDKKEIRSITLVACDKIYSENRQLENLVNIEKGCPILTLENTNNCSVIDERGEVNVFIGQNNVSIIFSDEKIVSCILNKNTMFYLNSNKQWVGLCLLNMEKNNLTVLSKLVEV